MDDKMTTQHNPNWGGSRPHAGPKPASLYDRALVRVRKSRQLSQYESFIMADWPEGDNHWRWILTASVREIVDWAVAGQS